MLIHEAVGLAITVLQTTQVQTEIEIWIHLVNMIFVKEYLIAYKQIPCFLIVNMQINPENFEINKEIKKKIKWSEAVRHIRPFSR